MRVRRLGGDRAGEIRLTRFLRNPSVTPAEMARTAGQATSGRCAGRHVLAIQDTTVVRSEGGGGLYLHAVVAVDADDGAILGLIGGQFLSRSEGRKAARRVLPIEQKGRLSRRRATAGCTGPRLPARFAPRRGE